MKKLKSYYLHLRHHQTMELKWIFPLAIGSIVSLFLLFLTTLTSSDSTSLLPFYRSFSISRSIFIKSKPYLIPDSLAASGRHALLLSTNVDPKQRYRLMTLMELGQHHQPIEAWRNNQLSREMNFYRERHCPLSEETPFCLIPFHNGYKIPVPWSDSLTKKTLSLFVHPSMTTIQSIKVRQIFDSCGNPTVEVDIILSNDTLARVVVPSGASTGFYEAFELRDGGKDYLGKGVSKAINNVNIIIDPALIGKDPVQLGKITEEELKQ